MAEIQIDWVQTARVNAVEMDKGRMTCMPEEAALLRGLANEIERLEAQLTEIRVAAEQSYRIMGGQIEKSEANYGYPKIWRLASVIAPMESSDG